LFLNLPQALKKACKITKMNLNNQVFCLPA